MRKVTLPRRILASQEQEVFVRDRTGIGDRQAIIKGNWNNRKVVGSGVRESINLSCRRTAQWLMQAGGPKSGQLVREAYMKSDDMGSNCGMDTFPDGVTNTKTRGAGRFTSSLPLRRLMAGLVLGALAGSLSGCGGTQTTTASSGGGGGTTTANPTATGNWQFNLTPTAGGTLFPSITGYVVDDTSDSSSAKFTTAEMTETSTTSCNGGTIPIFFTGSTTGAGIELGSLSINGQILSMEASLNSTSTTMEGSYSVSGGCANGAAGTFTGTEYDTLTGAFTGNINDSGATRAVTLNITQNGQGNGDGVFLEKGTATFTGFSCFSTGTLVVPTSYVTGSTVSMTINTPDPSGAQVILNGTFDVGADTITLPASSITVTAGTCKGTYSASGATSLTTS